MCGWRMVAAVCVVGAAVRASTSGPGGLEGDKRAWVRASTCVEHSSCFGMDSVVTSRASQECKKGMGDK